MPAAPAASPQRPDAFLVRIERLHVEERVPGGIEEAVVEVQEAARPPEQGAAPFLLQARVLVRQGDQLVGEDDERIGTDIERLKTALAGAAGDGEAFEDVLR